MNFTPFARPIFLKHSARTKKWAEQTAVIQQKMLDSLLQRGAKSEPGRKYGFKDILRQKNHYETYANRLPTHSYEDIREDVLRMVNGERNVLWPGICMNYAQSSGTSGGRSKFIPITADSLKNCHYRGASDTVAHYLKNNPESRIFAGKGFVLGGSFATELIPPNPKVRIGDLSATLIKRINPLANHFRIPDMRTALMADWQEKLPALVEASKHADVTNLSGVPSWFLTVIKEVIKIRGAEKISDVWPNLEVFFHGGISFEPYREIYKSLTDSSKMHFIETYNASEGFFAVQNEIDDNSMLLIIDNDIFYEFIDISDLEGKPRPIWEIEAGKVYEMLMTSSNGLWRYHLGDTVRVESINPVKIRVAGRTKTFINAFGEELMEENAERAIAAACRLTGSVVKNYTAAPVFATDHSKGYHQWLIEWLHAPSDLKDFRDKLDSELRKVNSDYDAKRSHTIFLDVPEIITLPHGSFDRWLRSVGNGKLGGQRKIPRLSNDRKIADALLASMRGQNS